MHFYVEYPYCDILYIAAAAAAALVLVVVITM
jgi:hypothetical protein